MKKNHLAIWVTAALLSLPFSSAFAADAADATAPAMEQGMQQGQMPEGQPPGRDDAAWRFQSARRSHAGDFCQYDFQK